MMYDEKWGEIVVDCLEEDLKVNKKLRYTNKNILEDLKKMGFKGSYRTLCNFIQEWKSEQEDEAGLYVKSTQTGDSHSVSMDEKTMGF